MDRKDSDLLFEAEWVKQPQGNRGGSEKAGLVDGFPSSVVFLICTPKLGKPPKLLAMGNGGGSRPGWV